MNNLIVCSNSLVTIARYCFLVFLSLLIASCGDKENSLSRDEIQTLCKKVGDKAFALANDGSKHYKELQWIEDGARAECELKYLGKK